MRRFFKSHLGRAFFVSIGDVALKGSTAILSLILARFLGPTDYGVFAAVTATSGVIMLCTNIGFEQEMVRRSPTRPVGELLTLTQGWVATAVVASLCVLAVYRGFASASSAIPASLLLLAVGADVAGRFQLPYRYASIVLKETHVGAVINSVGTASLIGLTLLVLWIARSVPTVLTVQILVALAVVAAWEIWRARRKIPHVAPTGGLAEARSFFQGALSFAFTNILWVLYFNVGIVMMTWLRPKDDVGVFSAVYRLVAMSFVLAFAITSVYSPSLFKVAHEEPENHGRLSRKMMLALAAAGLAVGGTLAAAAPVVIRIAVGPAFESGVGTARWLAAAAFLRSLNFGFSEILTTGGRHPWRIGLEGVLVAVYIALNYLWIPQYGPVGGARAALVAEAVMTTGGLVLWALLEHRLKMSGRPGGSAATTV